MHIYLPCNTRFTAPTTKDIRHLLLFFFLFVHTKQNHNQPHFIIICARAHLRARTMKKEACIRLLVHFHLFVWHICFLAGLTAIVAVINILPLAGIAIVILCMYCVSCTLPTSKLYGCADCNDTVLPYWIYFPNPYIQSAFNL